MLATHHEFVFFSRDCSPLSAMLNRSVLVRAPPNSIARIDSAVKNRAMNRTKIFAILVGALNAAVPVRGQDNLEPDCRRNVRPLLPQNSRGGGVAIGVRMNGKDSVFQLWVCQSRQERTSNRRFDLGITAIN
jgi:hypothetical protein